MLSPRRPSDRREPDRAALPAKIWASVWTSFWSSLLGGPTAIRKRRRLQEQIERGGREPEQQNARGQDQERVVPALPPPAGNARIFACL
jgi:hypothetical protein